MAEKKTAISRLEKWTTQTFALGIALFLSLTVILSLTVKWNEAPDLAKILPSENTVGFVSLSALDYLRSVSDLPEQHPLSLSSMQTNFTSLFGTSLENLDWFAGDLGMALIDNEWVYFLKARSHKKAFTYYEITFNSRGRVRGHRKWTL